MTDLGYAFTIYFVTLGPVKTIPVFFQGEQIGDEGCLSFPGFSFQVARPQRVVVRSQDINGNTFTLDVIDLEARCVSHETDHLDGDLFIDYLSPLKRDLVKRKIKKRAKQGDW